MHKEYIEKYDLKPQKQCLFQLSLPDFSAIFKDNITVSVKLFFGI